MSGNPSNRQGSRGELSTPPALSAGFGRDPAFTLIELLIVMAVIGLLAALLLPSLTRAKASAYRVGCLNNTHQITYAWLMYAHDNRDSCARNLMQNSSDPLWLNNFLSWDTNPANTNEALLQDGLLGRYTTGRAGTYRCPADRFLSLPQLAQGWTHRVRSYSMNSCVGLAFSGYYPRFRTYAKVSEIPKPSGIYLLMDEHADTISSPDIPTNPDPAGTTWEYLPASYHGGAGAFSFADGHSESHRWRLGSTRKPVTFSPPAIIPFAPYRNPDYTWVAERSRVTK